MSGESLYWIAGAVLGALVVMPAAFLLFLTKKVVIKSQPETVTIRYIRADDSGDWRGKPPHKPDTPHSPSGILIENWPTRTQIQARRNAAL